MMSGGKFVSSVTFAAFAGLVAIPGLMLLRPLWGSGTTIALGTIVLVSAYLAVTSPGWARGLRAGVLALVLGMAGFLLAPAAVVPYLSGILLGVLRSGLLYRSKVGRAMLLESALFVVATMVAEFLAGTTVVGFGLAVWGFFLVESAYFLFQGTSPRPASTATEDTFERAHREATRLMEGWPG